MSAGGRKNPLCCDVRSSWQQNPSEQGKSKQEPLVNLVLLSWVFPRTFLGASDSLPGPSCVHCPAFSHPGECHPMSPKPPTACVQGQGWAVQQHPELRNIHLQLGVACVTTHANMKIILLSLHFFYLQWFFLIFWQFMRNLSHHQPAVMGPKRHRFGAGGSSAALWESAGWKRLIQSVTSLTIDFKVISSSKNNESFFLALQDKYGSNIFWNCHGNLSLCGFVKVCW